MSGSVLSTRKKAFFALITTVVLLALANGGVALFERVTYGVSAEEKEAMYQETSSGRKVLKPGSTMSGSSTKVNINSMGFRGPELKSPKPENGFRIWVVGGSTTFDVYAPDDAHTWPALVGAKIQAARPDRVVEVINAGIPGEVIAGNMEDFETHAKAVQPDLLVYYHGPNDLRDIRFGGPPPPGGALEKEFALFRATRGAVNKHLPQLPESWAEQRPGSHDMNEIVRRIDQLLAAAKRHRTKVVMVSHAFQHTPGKTGDDALAELGEICVLLQMYPDNVVHLFHDYNQLVRGMAERLGMPFADVRSAVPGDAKYWGDALHFSASGSELAAEAVAQTILDSGLL